MQIETMHDLFVDELRGVYYLEKGLVEALDEMATNATNENIATGFADHRDETKQHAERLRGVFAALDLQPEERKCPIIDALNQDRHRVEGLVENEDLLNPFYLGAGMKTERIEITSYNSLLMMAEKLELGDEVTDPLEENLDSEENALTQLQTLSTASDLKTLWDKLTP